MKILYQIWYNYSDIIIYLHVKVFQLNIRLPAEWEAQKSITVVFPTIHKDWQHSLKEIQKTYVKLINTIREFQKCIVICNDKTILEQFFNSFKNIEIYEIQTNDTWIRDFGAIDFFKNAELKSYNFIFNAWGDKFSSNLDNDFNKNFVKTNLIDVDFILEGGSIESNGEGVLLTTSKCIFNKNRNVTKSKEEIISKIKELFELKELIILNHGALEGDDTDSHIDTLARFIDKDTIVYAKCYDKNDTHFDELNKMEKELEKTSFKLIPLPLPSPKFFHEERLPATYLNFIFINDAIILPIYNDKNDDLVIKILQQHIKNRVIKTVDSSILIREHGSLHCSSINQFA